MHVNVCVMVDKLSAINCMPLNDFCMYYWSSVLESFFFSFFLVGRVGEGHAQYNMNLNNAHKLFTFQTYILG